MVFSLVGYSTVVGIAGAGALNLQIARSKQLRNVTRIPKTLMSARKKYSAKSPFLNELAQEIELANTELQDRNSPRENRNIQFAGINQQLK